MTPVIQKTPAAFLALSVVAPGAALLVGYGTYHWDESLVLAGTIQLRLEKAIEFGCSRLQGFNCIAVGQGRQFAQNFTPPGTVVFFPDR